MVDGNRHKDVGYPARGQLAPANIGQLKHFATRAEDHLNQALDTRGGAGSAAVNFAPGASGNYAPLNLGQLKNVAKPFYDRLRQVGFDTNASLKDHGYPASWTSIYPWSLANPVGVENNYAPVNLGQLKMVFSFDARRDGDFDGISDIDEIAGGSNPDDPDSDHDGVPDGGEPPGDIDGDGDQNWDDNDRDGDDVNDGTDLFPNDGRRSEYIPAKFYGLIDLEADLQERFPVAEGGIPNHGGVKPLISISDTHQIAFAGIGTSTELDPFGRPFSFVRVVVWKDGQVEPERDTRKTLGYSVAGGYVTIELQPVGITPAGVLRGNATVTRHYTQYNEEGQLYEVTPTGFGGIFTFSNGNLTLPVSEEVPIPDELHVINREGSAFWVDSEPVSEGPRNYKLTPVFSNALGSHRFTEHVDKACVGWAMSDNGQLLWEAAPENEAPQMFVWDSVAGTNTPIAFPEGVSDYAINDQKQIIARWNEPTSQQYPDGNGGTRSGRGELGLFWENGLAHPFVDKLPGKFREELRSVIPYHISNVAPGTQSVTVYFTAEALEGDEGQEHWVAGRHFTWSRDQAGTSRIDGANWPESVAEAPSPKITKASQNKGVVATVNAEPYFGLGYRFEPQDGNVDAGFDQPMPNDRTKFGGLQDVAPTGQLHCVWWTSVGTKEPFKVSTKVKLVFDGSPYGFALRNRSPSLFSVTASSGQFVAAPGGITTNSTLAAETRLTITGLAPSNPAGAVLELIDLKRAPTRLVAELRVRVLPVPEPLTVQFYKVIDQNNAANPVQQIPNLAPPHAAKNLVDRLTEIESELNNRFAQACVRFAVIKQIVDVAVNYDGENFGGRDGYIDGREATYINREKIGLFPAEVPILCVKRLVPGIGAMFTVDQQLIFVGNDFYDPSVVNLANITANDDPLTRRNARYERAVAHEVGHRLQLSTRQFGQAFTHDNGPYPELWKDGVAVYRTWGLMWNPGEEQADDHGGLGWWLRHEDWQQANDRAVAIKGAQ